MACSRRGLFVAAMMYIARYDVFAASQPFVEVGIEAISNGVPTRFETSGFDAVQGGHPSEVFAAENFDSSLAFIKVNDYYITPLGIDEPWQVSPIITLMVRKPVDTLVVKVQFKKQGVEFQIPWSTVGQVMIRPSNSSLNAITVDMDTHSSHVIAASVDLGSQLDKIQQFSSGLHSVQIRLTSPVVKEALTVTLGEVDLRKFRARHLPEIGFLDLWDGSIWGKFVERCEQVPSYEAMVENRLWWAEALISLFSVGYCSAVCWLGPLDFTPWQQRCYQVACVSSALFQVVFGLSQAKSISIQVTATFATVFGLIYLVSFNLTNVLILCEYSQTVEEVDGDDNGGPAISMRRPGRTRTFNSIPPSNQLNGMTRVVMIGYKKARFC